jgi:peroxiredoxin
MSARARRWLLSVLMAAATMILPAQEVPGVPTGSGGRGALGMDSKPDAPEAAAETPEAALKALVAAVSGKIAAGRGTEAGLAEEIARFDVLLQRYAGRKSDAVARILLMKAMLYVEVLEDYDRGWALLERLQREFAGSLVVKTLFPIIQRVEREMANAGLQVLKVGETFPAFSGQDLTGKAVALDKLRGRVVLVHVWATWHDRCLQELPHLVAAYRQHHERGFDIVSISLDEDRAALARVAGEQGLAWPQLFEGRRWDNRIVQEVGITNIPATYLLDRDGKIVARYLRGTALPAAVDRLMSK